MSGILVGMGVFALLMVITAVVAWCRDAEARRKAGRGWRRVTVWVSDREVMQEGERPLGSLEVWRGASERVAVRKFRELGLVEVAEAVCADSWPVRVRMRFAAHEVTVTREEEHARVIVHLIWRGGK